MTRANELTIEELMEVVGKDAKAVSNLRDDSPTSGNFYESMVSRMALLLFPITKSILITVASGDRKVRSFLR